MIATILSKFSRYSIGDKVAVDVDVDNIPQELFWRKRLRDGDIEMVAPKAVIETPTAEPAPKPTKAKAEE